MADMEKELESKEFTVALRGYDRDEVDAYLAEVAQTLRTLKAGRSEASSEPAGPSAENLYKRVGEETSRILLAAEEASKEIRSRAEAEAVAIIADARTRSEEVARAADEERRRLEEDLRGLRESRDMLANQLADVARRLEENLGRLKLPIDQPIASAPAPTKERPSPPTASRAQPAISKPAAKEPVPPSALQKPPPLEPAVAEKEMAPPAGDQVATDEKPTAIPATQTKPAASATADTKAIEDLLAEIRVERERGRQEVEEALASPPTGVAKTEPPQAAIDQMIAELEPAPELPAAEAAVAPVPEVVLHPMLALRNTELGDASERAPRRLKRLLQEDQNFILDRLRTQKGKGSFDETISPVEQQQERFREGLMDSLGGAFDAGRKAAGLQKGGTAAKSVTDLVVRQLVGPLRRDLSRIVDAGFAAGDTPKSISERASDIYRVWKGVRTELLGEGLVYAAFHQGLMGAWREQKVGKKRWIVSPDEGECPKNVCETNAAAGSVDIGKPFPSGHSSPPAHGGCTCTLAEG